MLGIQDVTRAYQASSFTNTGVDVGTTSTLILGANPKRVYAAIINDSDTDIYLAIGAPAVAHQGIRINANGGVYEIAGFNLHTLAIYGIHAGTGTKRVCVVEGTA